MIELAAPAALPLALLAALLALLLPLRAGLAWPRSGYRGGQLAAALAGQSAAPTARRYQWRLRAALLLLAAVTLQPQWLAGQQLIEERRSELVVAIDLSESMASADFMVDGAPIERLAAVKQLLRPWLLDSRDEQLALLVFGAQAYVQMPFSADRELFVELLDDSEIGSAGDKTMIGDAIGLAVALFEGRPPAAEGAPRRLLLLTDGVDSGSLVPPLEAAKVAASSGVAIYPVALGDPARDGDYPVALELLAAVAEITAGELLQAADGEQLAAVYARLDGIAPAELQRHWQPRRIALYPYLLLLATLLLWSQSGLAGALRRGAQHD